MNNIVNYAIGIDLGGTFVKMALVSDTGESVFNGKLPIGSHASKNTILNTIEKIIQMALSRANTENYTIIGIGIGTPGIVQDGVILGGSENLDGWENIDLANYYNSIFNLPVLVDNDANLMGLGEYYYGAAKGLYRCGFSHHRNRNWRSRNY